MSDWIGGYLTITFLELTEEKEEEEEDDEKRQGTYVPRVTSIDFVFKIIRIKGE